MQRPASAKTIILGAVILFQLLSLIAIKTQAVDIELAQEETVLYQDLEMIKQKIDAVENTNSRMPQVMKKTKSWYSDWSHFFRVTSPSMWLVQLMLVAILMLLYSVRQNLLSTKMVNPNNMSAPIMESPSMSMTTLKPITKKSTVVKSSKSVRIKVRKISSKKPKK